MRQKYRPRFFYKDRQFSIFPSLPFGTKGLNFIDHLYNPCLLIWQLYNLKVAKHLLFMQISRVSGDK